MVKQPVPSVATILCLAIHQAPTHHRKLEETYCLNAIIIISGPSGCHVFACRAEKRERESSSKRAGGPHSTTLPPSITATSSQPITDSSLCAICSHAFDMRYAQFEKV